MGAQREAAARPSMPPPTRGAEAGAPARRRAVPMPELAAQTPQPAASGPEGLAARRTQRPVVPLVQAAAEGQAASSEPAAGLGQPRAARAAREVAAAR
ncbi:MAG: hypothetical protein ABI560_09630 [Myxococcales bacterium]